VVGDIAIKQFDWLMLKIEMCIVLIMYKKSCEVARELFSNFIDQVNSSHLS